MPLQLVEQLTASQIVDLHALYQREWWSRERSIDDVRIMVANSTLIVGFADEDGKLVAFCRVLTDFVFRATIYDVIVAEPLRGRGLGRKLMDTVAGDSRLMRVSVIALDCHPDMVGFYERWGFQVFDEEPVRMIKAQREG